MTISYCSVSLLLLWTSALVAGQSAPATVGATDAGYVAGQVVDSGGNPIRSAVVTLRLDGSIDQTKVLSNQDGRFAFQRVAPGDYRLEVSRAGYGNGSYGRMSTGMPDRVLTVGPGGHRTDLKLLLWKEAVVAGRVLDDRGKPLPGVPVRLVYARPHQRVSGATWFLVWPTIITTDDLGNFRFTAPPGRYTVLVTPPPVPDGIRSPTGHAPLLTGDGDVLRTFLPTFHPAASSPEEAVLHDVGPGEVKSNIDVQLVPSGAVRVNGRVAAPMPLPEGTLVRLVPDYANVIPADDATEAGRAPLEANGAFALAGVPAGLYRLRLIAPRSSNPIWLDHVVAVAAPATTVDAAVDTGLTITGKATFIGEKHPTAVELTRTTLNFVPIDGPSVGFTPVRLNGQDRFEAGPYPAGRYFASATAPPGWSLREVRVGGTDGSRIVFDVRDRTLEDVEFVFVPGTSSVEGRVLGAPSDWPRTLVIMFPESHSTEPSSLLSGRRRQATYAGDDGTFRFPDVPPGDYFIVATDVEIGSDWQWDASLRRLSGQAIRLRVTETQSHKISIPGRRDR